MPVPDFLYGTAWKEDRTQVLTELALRTGFRGIDTANQRRHYFEAGVGQALAAAYRAGVMPTQIVFRFALAVGMLPLTGTSSAEHMRQDLASRDLPLSADEVRAIESLSG